ncbi:FliI/YscN family ATPase [Donghicola sp. C2-DW-16]|uniref:FliI/YscN family ATPase n=1 Tax=Donghicola mangrovi TaxID=2729614 RepID=A0ABX2P937_9RHOB|nr:FliI/YscN family ATPase [Donghicola mangrovi]NVO25961.1 FliI/YscN family ATPase [Donghicola mangrovi]
MTNLAILGNQLGALQAVKECGRISAVKSGVLRVSGLIHRARLGDVLGIRTAEQTFDAEVIGLEETELLALPERSPAGCAIGDSVEYKGARRIAPDASWLGRIIDPWGRPLDGRPLASGRSPMALDQSPPPAAHRRGLGERMPTGLNVFDTVLPLVRGQRMGIFAGSGVGKSHLLGQLAGGVGADVRVIALIGERGRELGAFVKDVLGPEVLAKSVVVAATSDQSPLLRLGCLPAATCVAEHFRDQGQQVLLLADSITRFAEAYREIAVAGGEAPSLRGYPASMTPALMRLAERAGPGQGDQGDITALMTVLVAGSDMEEPIADLVRGTLDGHVILDRRIAERGRYPAIDVLKSVSRSLPDAASLIENRLISELRAALGEYARAEPMIRAGLHSPGADPMLDRAIRLWPRLDAFVAERNSMGPEAAFRKLADILTQPRR